MNDKTTYKNSKGKEVSLCFLDGEAFKALTEGLDDEQLVELFHEAQRSAEEVIDLQNKKIARARRAITKLEGMKNTEAIIAKNEETIDKAQNLIDNLEDEGAWWNVQQEILAGMFGDEDEED